MKQKIFLFAFVVFLLSACSKVKTGETIDNSNTAGIMNEPGYGGSNMPFSAASWQLPAGIQLEDSIHDYSYCYAFPPYTQVQPKDWKGIPPGFSFCLTLRNTRTVPVIVQFPPQLAFSSSSALHQNVLTIELGQVELMPGASRTIVAQGFCINKGRKIPQTFDEGTGNFLGYAFGPSIIPSPLQEVVDIVRSKNITMQDVLKPDGTFDSNKILKYAVIQKAIWEITDEQGLTANTKAQLLAL